MKKQFPLLEVLGGILGIAATAILMWSRFGIEGPPVLRTERLGGNIIFTVLLLVPYVAAIVTALALPVKTRWPVLLSSSLLSLLWLTASKVAENFPEFPFPHPVETLFSLNMLFFFPAAIFLLIAMVLSLRYGALLTLSPRKTIILGVLSLFTACLLVVSLHVLFLRQGSELWTRGMSNGAAVHYSEWMRTLGLSQVPEYGAGYYAQELLEAGIVKPSMAWISAGLLVLGISSFAILGRIASHYSPDLLKQ